MSLCRVERGDQRRGRICFRNSPLHVGARRRLRRRLVGPFSENLVARFCRQLRVDQFDRDRLMISPLEGEALGREVQVAVGDRQLGLSGLDFDLLAGRLEHDRRAFDRDFHVRIVDLDL